MAILKSRFENNMGRHQGVAWKEVEERLLISADKLWSLSEMERTDGEPDVIGIDEKTGEYLFCDCSVESPVGRRNVCYDRQAWESRKTFRPESNAVDMAEKMGLEILTENEYRRLQELGEFDLKTSSWIKTPDEVRELGGALFMDRRYNKVFVYHNGASSYYAARGFRCILRI